VPAPSIRIAYAYRISFHVTAAPLYGGIRFPFAIGAVVEGVEVTCQTPDSGQVSPVRAVVPMAVITFSSSKPVGTAGFD
jgi:hypothetical protein